MMFANCAPKWVAVTVNMVTGQLSNREEKYILGLTLWEGAELPGTFSCTGVLMGYSTEYTSQSRMQED